LYFQATLNMSEHVSNTIERNTRGQSTNPQWVKARHSKLTASKFRPILVARDKEDFCRKLHERMNDSLINIPACKFGLESELPAMRLYTQQFRDEVGLYYQPGLCVSKHFTNLAATPDFIVYKDPFAKAQPPTSSYGAWLVEVKSFMDNPNASNLYELAQLRGKTFCVEFMGPDRMVVRKEHAFYYQIIGQLNIVFGEDPAAFCDLVMYYKRQITTVRIYNDLEHWRRMRDPLIDASYVYLACT
jgi:Viral alkaline exonuclease